MYKNKLKFKYTWNRVMFNTWNVSVNVRMYKKILFKEYVNEPIMWIFL